MARPGSKADTLESSPDARAGNFVARSIVGAGTVASCQNRCGRRAIRRNFQRPLSPAGCEEFQHAVNGLPQWRHPW